jgi:hypothetical protein
MDVKIQVRQSSIFAKLGIDGKGSHTVWSHQDLDYSIILSGRDSADAQRYQEKDVRNALRDLAKLEDEDSE